MILSGRYYIIYLFIASMLGVISGKNINAILPLIVVAVLSCLSFVILLLLRQSRSFALLCVVFSIFSLYTFQQSQVTVIEERQVNVEARVFGGIRQSNPMKTSFLVDQLFIDGESHAGKAYCTVWNRELNGIVLRDGACISFTAKRYSPRSSNSKYAFDFAFYLKQNHIDYSFTSVRNLNVLNESNSYPYADIPFRIREQIFNNFSKYMTESNADIASALLFSHKNDWESEDRTIFTKLGVAHIFAVSGMHISLMASILYFVLKKLKAGKILRFLCTALALGIYAYVCGFSPATQRALLMFLYMGLAGILFRPYHSIFALSFAGLIILAINPLTLYSASFIFSFSAMLGIILLAKRIRSFFLSRHFFKAIYSHRLKSFLRQVFSLLSISISAQIAVLLPSIYYYGQINLTSLLFNLLLIPYVAILAPVLLATLCLLWLPFVGAFFAAISNAMLSFMLQSLRVSYFVLPVQLPSINILSACVILLCIFLLLKGIVKYSFFKRLLCSLSLAILYGVYLFITNDNILTYTQLSVGRADCAVIEDEKNTFVIDTGESGYELVNYLKAKSRNITGLFISHFDWDHYGGVFALMEREIPIQTLYIPSGALQSRNKEEAQIAAKLLQDYGVEIIELKIGDSITSDHVSFQVFFPATDHVLENRPSNDGSLAMLIELKGTKLLTVGDLGYPYEQYAARSCDIVKIGHHGSKTSSSAEFIQSLSAKVALLSTNQSNGFPHEAVLQTLLENGLDIYNTGLHGDIVVQFSEQGYKVIK